MLYFFWFKYSVYPLAFLDWVWPNASYIDLVYWNKEMCYSSIRKCLDSMYSSWKQYGQNYFKPLLSLKSVFIWHILYINGLWDVFCHKPHSFIILVTFVSEITFSYLKVSRSTSAQNAPIHIWPSVVWEHTRYTTEVRGHSDVHTVLQHLKWRAN